MDEPRLPRLLDAYGRPVKRQELTQPQAEPGLTGLRQIWTHSVASGLTPERLAGILQCAAEGDPYDYMILAEEMEERDPHYAAQLGTRKRALSGIDPIVHAASDSPEDERIADAVRERIAEHSQFADLIEDLLDGLGKGYAVVEIDWARSAREWWPREFVWRDPRWFRPDRETGREIRLLDLENPVEGLQLAPFKFMVHRPKLKSGVALRGGIARLVAFSWMCKAYTVKDWMAFIEAYGLPMRVGRYGPHHTPDDVRVLKQAVASLGSDAAAVLPMSMQIDFEGLNSGPGYDVFEKMARWCDEQVSKAVVGQTMTADDGSSQSQANVHNDVRLDICQADSRQVCGTLERDLVRAFVDLNFGPQERYPTLALPVEEPEDIEAKSIVVDRYARMGVTFDARELREGLGFTRPDEDDPEVEIVGGAALMQASMAPPPLQPDPPAPAAPGQGAEATNQLLKLLSAMRPGGGQIALNRETSPYAEIDAAAADALLNWERQMAPIIGPVEKLAKEAGSLEEFNRRLPELLEEMELAELVDALAAAMFIARVDGDLDGDLTGGNA